MRPASTLGNCCDTKSTTDTRNFCRSDGQAPTVSEVKSAVNRAACILGMPSAPVCNVPAGEQRAPKSTQERRARNNCKPRFERKHGGCLTFDFILSSGDKRMSSTDQN